MALNGTRNGIAAREKQSILPVTCVYVCTAHARVYIHGILQNLE